MIYKTRTGTKQPKKQQPHLWKTGPDPRTHWMYRVYIQARNQCNFRHEEWDFTFENWKEKWGDKFEQRGRESTSFAMTRKDKLFPWSVDNTFIGTRAETMSYVRKNIERDRIKT